MDLFKYEPVLTEYTVYRLLKESPIQNNINYLVIPWSVLINRKQLHKIPEIKINKGFTVCQHIDYEQIIPILKKIGIDILFTPHVTKECTKKYNDIIVLPFPHLAVNGIAPNNNKDIIYSFVGCKNTHWTRKEIFKMQHLKNSVIIRRNNWHFNRNDKKFEREYKNILSRSVFSLCPRGTGTSTIRFWESLQAGAIPVLISDDMILPDVFDWNSCIIRIPEKEVRNIPKIISLISKDKQKNLRTQCMQAYCMFSGKNFVKIIRDYYI